VTGSPSPAALTLHLLRHAKSSWDDGGQADIERPLAPRGRRAARRLAAQLRREGVRPRLVLCSSARRALQTLELVRPALPATAEILAEDRLYAATGEELLDRLRQVPIRLTEVLLVGHNPGIHDLALALAGPTAPAGLRDQLPTGALVSLRLGVLGWPDVGPGTGTFVRLLLPREL
jgi:phosphohistidine phosphatase